MIKEINDPTLQVGDTVRMQYPSKYDVVFGFAYTPEVEPMGIDFGRIFDSECTVMEIDDKKLIA